MLEGGMRCWSRARGDAGRAHQVGQQPRGARGRGCVLQHAQPLQHVLQPHLRTHARKLHIRPRHAPNRPSHPAFSSLGIWAPED